MFKDVDRVFLYFSEIIFSFGEYFWEIVFFV